MTDTETATDRDASLAELTALSAFPETTASDTIDDCGDEVIIHHANGDRTRVTIGTQHDRSPHVASVVHYTATMPELTPADDIWVTDDETRIIHGPGHETRVRPASSSE